MVLTTASPCCCHRTSGSLTKPGAFHKLNYLLTTVTITITVWYFEASTLTFLHAATKRVLFGETMGGCQ